MVVEKSRNNGQTVAGVINPTHWRAWLRQPTTSNVDDEIVIHSPANHADPADFSSARIRVHPREIVFPKRVMFLNGLYVVCGET